MDNTIEYLISNGFLSDYIMPLADQQLCCNDSGMHNMPVFNDLNKRGTVMIIQGCIPKSSSISRSIFLIWVISLMYEPLAFAIFNIAKSLDGLA